MKQTQILTQTQHHSFIQRTPFRQTHTHTTMLIFELLNTDTHTCTPAQTCTESHTHKQYIKLYVKHSLTEKITEINVITHT